MICRRDNFNETIRFICLLPLAFCLFAAMALAQTVTKVEPPSWWAGHSINPVRLMVRGENFAGARIVSRNPMLKASNLRVNDRGDYLFFDVTIPKTAKIGKYEFEVVTPKGKSAVPFEILPPHNPDLNFKGIGGKDVIYLIMTDRFADGDPANNKNVDRTNPRMWHGGDFKGITEKIPYLKELGVTAIWLTPWYDNSNEITTCDKPWCPMASYHGYGAVDYYGVEDHFGTMDDLRTMIAAAKANGIKVIQDQVANHFGFRHPWTKNPPTSTWTPPFEQNRFNNSSLLSPNASRNERANTLSGWFDFTLPDLNQNDPEVRKYLIQNALWWIGVTGIDGIRQDTIQYMPRDFIRDWSLSIKKQYPKFWMVGEVFEEDSAHTAFFQGGKPGWDGIDTNLPSVFDFKLWRTSQEVFTGKKPMRALRDVLKYDALYPNVNDLTVMTNNHDTDRFMSLQGATKEGAKLHTAFVLATRGIPQLYAGEEILMEGGHDPDNRRDFPGGFPGDTVDKFAESGRAADEREMFEWTRKWIDLRRKSIAFSFGKTTDLFYDSDSYVFDRSVVNVIEISAVIVAFNNSDKTKVIELPFGSVRPKPLISDRETVTIEGGKLKMVLAPKSAIAYGH
ncbi:MAG: cyclomaltodextrinase N-terminal domain-containing protein [Acidobacteria bacterium]|nr:cyclomaltodextrinase N-terminal domain-containing protein [Acidobacteriota bacterium]